MAAIGEIAELVGAPAPPAAYEILRVSSIEAATPVALVFATDAATLEAALNSAAGAILTPPELLLPRDGALTQSDVRGPLAAIVCQPCSRCGLVTRPWSNALCWRQKQTLDA